MSKLQYHVAAGRYEGRSVLVTGAANGLGFATASRLGAEGAKVGLIDRDADGVGHAAEHMRDDGHEAFAYAADVRDPERIREVVDDFTLRTGAIDGLVTMAGTYPWIDFAAMTLDDWQDVIAVNLAGTFVCAHAAMPAMKRQGYGRMVTISSGTVLLGIPEQSAYIASKAGVIGFTRVLAREGGPHGITANCVLPGLIATERVLSMREDVDEFFGAIVAEQCVKRRGAPADVADAVAHLCSEGAAFITGQTLYVGGGDRFL